MVVLFVRCGVVRWLWMCVVLLVVGSVGRLCVWCCVGCAWCCWLCVLVVRGGVGCSWRCWLCVVVLAVRGCGCGLANQMCAVVLLPLVHIVQPTRLLSISYAVFCLKKKKRHSVASGCAYSILYQQIQLHLVTSYHSLAGC